MFFYDNKQELRSKLKKKIPIFCKINLNSWIKLCVARSRVIGKTGLTTIQKKTTYNIIKKVFNNLLSYEGNKQMFLTFIMNMFLI